MIKQLSKEFILKHKGCYSTEQVECLSFINNETISLIDLLNSEIPLKDKRWFLYNKCDLSLDFKKELSLKMAWVVLPIYEAKYPNDNRVKDCLEGIEKFNKGEINFTDLTILRKANADAAADAAYVAAYADAAYAAAYADAAYAAAYAATYADADVTAADVTDKINVLSYSNQLVSILIDFINTHD